MKDDWQLFSTKKEKKDSFQPADASVEGQGPSSQSYAELYNQQSKAYSEGPSASAGSYEQLFTGRSRPKSQPTPEPNAGSEAPKSPARPAHIRLPQGFTLAQRDIPANQLPRLSRRAEQQLQANYRELSVAEGNILAVNRKLQTLYITSCFQGEGKTTAALNTAYALSMISSKRVALVEGQVPGMQISKMLNIPAAPGLSDVLSTNVPLAQVLWPTAYEGLYVLPSGTLDQHHSHSYLDLFNFVLDELCEHFDYVLYDGAAIMTSSEATALANVFDALVLVVQCEKTKWEVVQMAEEKIRKAQGNIIGVILNKRRYYLPKLVYNLISKGVGR